MDVKKQPYHRTKWETYEKVLRWLNHFDVDFVKARLQEKIDGHKELEKVCDVGPIEEKGHWGP